jgi:hypothetical protein
VNLPSSCALSTATSCPWSAELLVSPCHKGGINTGTWAFRVGVERKADDLPMYTIIVKKTKEVETGCSNLLRKFLVQEVPVMLLTDIIEIRN